MPIAELSMFCYATSNQSYRLWNYSCTISVFRVYKGTRAELQFISSSLGLVIVVAALVNVGDNKVESGWLVVSELAVRKGGLVRNEVNKDNNKNNCSGKSNNYCVSYGSYFNLNSTCDDVNLCWHVIV